MHVSDWLLAAYRIVSRELGRERMRRFPDAQRLARLKKERLAIKDRLARHAPTNGYTLAFVRGILARAGRV
ncbi:YdcH family protein [Sphingomonas lenta]|nr:YdcH family protein [Sphingomonas lenta]